MGEWGVATEATTVHNLPAGAAVRLEGIFEILGHGRRGERDDQGDGDQKLFHRGSPLDVAGLGS